MSDVGKVSLDAIASFVGPASLRFYIAAFVLEIVFFCGFVVTYAIATWILLYRAHPQARRQRSNLILFVANTIMFLLSMAVLQHLACDVYNSSRGFLEITWGVEAAKFMCYVTQTLIGDGFMIYRLYVVYSRHWPVAVLPTVLLLLDAVVGYTSTFLGLAGFYMSVAFYSLSLIVNIICTVLILGRVLQLSRDFHGVFPRGSKLKVWKVLEATVQSTAIYSAASISLVVTFVNSTAVGYPTCLNIFPSLIGLVFSFIVIRVAHNMMRVETRPDSQYQGSSSTRQTTSSATYVEQERPSMLQALGYPPITIERITREPTELTDVIIISKNKTDSEMSLPLPYLEQDEMCEAV